MIGLPIEVVHDLAIGTGERQFAIGRFVFHVALFFARQPSCSGAAGPQWLVVDGAGIEHGLHIGKWREALQGANGGENDEEVTSFMALERIDGTDPNRLKLFGFIGHRQLPFGHARHQKRHIEALGQIAVGDPVGQHIDLVGGQFQAEGGTLVGKGLAAVELGDVLRIGHALVGPVGQQNAQLFKAFANGGNGLREVQVTLSGPAQSMCVRGSIEGINAAAWKHVGTRCKAGFERAPSHEHFNALGAVAQQQHCGGRPCGGGLSLGM